MTIFEQIRYWIDVDGMDFILTVFFSLLFFEGVLPHWIDDIKALCKKEEEDPKDLM